jgi:hypothetical protein
VRIECALLCDAASVRDGLLHMLGGGITSTILPELPSPLPITFALRAILEPKELHPEHHLRVRLVSQQGKVEGIIEITFKIPDPGAATEEAALVVPVPLGSFGVERTGRYLIEADLDHRRLGTFPLRVEKGQARPEEAEQTDPES